MKKILLTFTILLIIIPNTFAINIEFSDKIIDDTIGSTFIPNNVVVDYGNDLKLVKQESQFSIRHYDNKEYDKQSFSKKNEVYSFLESKLGTKNLQKALDSGEIYAIEPIFSSRGRLNFGTGNISFVKANDMTEKSGTGIDGVLDKLYTFQTYIFESDKDIKDYKMRFYLIDPNNYGAYTQFSWQSASYNGLPIAKLSYYNDIDLPQSFHVMTGSDGTREMSGSGYILQKYKYTDFGNGEIKNYGYSLIPYVDYSVEIKKGKNILELNYYKYISPYCSVVDEDCKSDYKIYSSESYN